METVSTRKVIATVVVIVALGASGIYFLSRPGNVLNPTPITEKEESSSVGFNVFGASALGRSIGAYTYGNGATRVAFIGGIHGGYEWNSVLLAYELMDYLEKNPSVIPENLSVTIIPNANPDGVFKIIGKEGRFTIANVPEGDHSEGRFNANNVDLNRNFDCKWKPEAVWKGKTVSAGTAPFSEPEAKALKEFVLKTKPSAVVFWHSQADAVYASECEDGILSETLAVMNAYAKASGYKAVQSFDSYEVTGDAEGWLASIGIPAITVELKTHETIEWEKNLAGVKAVLGYYAEK